MDILTREEMQKLDAESIASGISSLTLMENAGRAVAKILLHDYLKKKGRVLVVCGTGNNGGDGLVVARLLFQKKIPVTIFIVGDEKKIKGDCFTQYKKCSKKIPIFFIQDQKDLKIKNHSVIVDALFGTGLSRPLTDLHQVCVDWMNNLQLPIVSIDIPSGLDSNTGEVLGSSIAAHRTITLGLPKLGLFVGEAHDFVGIIDVVPIGLRNELLATIAPTYHLVTQEKIEILFKKRKKNSHKGSFGHVFVIGGSLGKIGAGVLSCFAALKAGAGLATFILPKNSYQRIDHSYLEVMYEPIGLGDYLRKEDVSEVLEKIKEASVVVLGPGLGIASSTIEFVHEIISKIKAPLILDADALNALALNPDLLHVRKYPTLLTPHPGEMGRLLKKSTEEIQKNRVSFARNFSTQYGVCLILKGYRTLIAFSDGTLWVNPTGNPSQSNAGQGDVLCGILAGLISEHQFRPETILGGPFLAGMVADTLEKKGHRVVLASDILSHWKAHALYKK